MGEIIHLKKNKIRPRLKKRVQNKPRILIKHSIFQNEKTYWCLRCGVELEKDGNRYYCPDCHTFVSDRLADNVNPNWW